MVGGRARKFSENAPRPRIPACSKISLRAKIHGVVMNPKDICKNIDIRIRPQAEVLASQVLSIADKLEESRELMANEPIVVEYDNGGGQSGVRENPYFSAYEKLLASYTKSLSVLKDLIGDQAPAETATLDDLRAKFKVIA